MHITECSVAATAPPLNSVSEFESFYQSRPSQLRNTITRRQNKLTKAHQWSIEYVTDENRNKDPEAGSRKLPFSKELYIERKDFQIENDGDFYRLTPGQDVRLKHAYKVRCTGFELNDDGSVKEIHCTYYGKILAL